MYVHHTKNNWRGLDEGGNETDPKGQEKHPSKEKQNWRDEDNIRERGELR